MATEIIPPGVSMPLHKTDNLSLAEDNLRATETSLEKQLAAVRRALSSLRDARFSGAAEQHIPSVKPGEFGGMRAVDALAAYLKARRGIKIPLSRAVADLVAGGTEPGQPRGRKNDPAELILHTLKIALPNATRLFSWEPTVPTLKGLPGVPKGNVEITVWLAATADTPKPIPPSRLKRRKAVRRA